MDGKGDEEVPILTCVEYPGKVQNVDNMLQSLGGIRNISETASDPNLRLDLRFRPNDLFSKPTCGNRTDQSGLLLRVRRYRNKEDPGQFKIAHEICGVVTSTFKFDNMCDFQYLPMQKVEEKEKRSEKRKNKEKKGEEVTYKSIYDQVNFDKLPDTSWYANEEAVSKTPLFLPPPVFSRIDTHQEYNYKRETASEKMDLTTPYHIIGKTRQRRYQNTIFVTFESNYVPKEPKDVAKTQLQVKFISSDDMRKLREKFEELPIWTKNALVCHTGIQREKMKYMLPSLAYYFTTGPWRNQWAKLGFDPRKDATAAKLQSLDYRVRLQGGAKQKIKAKRSYAHYVMPYKSANIPKPKTSSILDKTPTLSTSSKIEEEELQLLEDSYMFRPDRMPPYRQMFYQFQHLKLESAQTLIKASLNPDGSCNEKSGYYKAGLDQELRELLTQCINNLLRTLYNDNVEDVTNIEDEDDLEDGESSDESD